MRTGAQVSNGLTRQRRLALTWLAELLDRYRYHIPGGLGTYVPNLLRDGSLAPGSRLSRNRRLIARIDAVRTPLDSYRPGLDRNLPGHVMR